MCVCVCSLSRHRIVRCMYYCRLMLKCAIDDIGVVSCRGYAKVCCLFYYTITLWHCDVHAEVLHCDTKVRCLFYYTLTLWHCDAHAEVLHSDAKVRCLFYYTLTLWHCDAEVRCLFYYTLTLWHCDAEVRCLFYYTLTLWSALFVRLHSYIVTLWCWCRDATLWC